ncbi:hypothetical protein AM228_18390 [Planktothricoides sp. SR001]|uniref:hypothetical protein n=1 Tax=Planktothricoides sp. SR001 TaxID=1705388 RepID=UPI0006C6AFA0|nr:hypothetical protein [Planktothricoides sp. SR001]KOR35429.1 hypothetical protein AM228_18390 [Planktothricoides sp. SR001]
MSKTAFTWPGHRKNDPAHLRLSEFLIMDIQHSPEWARDLLDKITLIQSGSLQTWQRIGNAFCLSLSYEGATIEDLIDESNPPETVLIEEFHQAAIAWLQHTEMLSQSELIDN